MVIAAFDHLDVIDPGQLRVSLRAVSAARINVGRSNDDPAVDEIVLFGRCYRSRMLSACAGERPELLAGPEPGRVTPEPTWTLSR